MFKFARRVWGKYFPSYDWNNSPIHKSADIPVDGFIVISLKEYRRLRLRLAKRSLALVQFLARRRSALVCFLASPRSRGSLLACRLAARFGVSVFVFCVGFSPSRLPRLGRGSWSLVQVAGSSACQWSPKLLKNQMIGITTIEIIITAWSEGK